MARSREQWPPSVAEAVNAIVSGLSSEDREVVRNTSESELIRFHHGWGTGIRNAFGLWAGNGKLARDCGRLIHGSGGLHPDEASGVIIKAVWNSLNDRPLAYRQRLLSSGFRCIVCGKVHFELEYLDMPDDPLTPDQKASLSRERCEGCEGRPVPPPPPPQDPGVSPEVWRVWFEKARELGLKLQEYHRSESRLGSTEKEVDGSHFLKIAKKLYKENPEFRQLWDEVKDVSPRRKHSRWLSIWR